MNRAEQNAAPLGPRVAHPGFDFKAGKRLSTAMRASGFSDARVGCVDGELRVSGERAGKEAVAVTVSFPASWRGSGPRGHADTGYSAEPLAGGDTEKSGLRVTIRKPKAQGRAETTAIARIEEALV